MYQTRMSGVEYSRGTDTRKAPLEYIIRASAESCIHLRVHPAHLPLPVVLAAVYELHEHPLELGLLLACSGRDGGQQVVAPTRGTQYGALLHDHLPAAQGHLLVYTTHGWQGEER